MLVSPRISLLITAAPTADVPPQALPRVTVRADAGPTAESAPDYAAAREAYLAKFPQSAMMFELGDFSLFLIRPVAFRLIAGFGSATTLPADALAHE
jgi:putative heme iron utilization protein